MNQTQFTAGLSSTLHTKLRLLTGPSSTMRHIYGTRSGREIYSDEAANNLTFRLEVSLA